MNAVTPRRWIPVSFIFAMALANAVAIAAVPAQAADAAARPEPAEGPATPPANTRALTALPAPRSGLHLAEFPVHDPWILADTNTKTYYLYSAAGLASPGHTGTLYYKSADLLNWDGPYICFVCPDDSWADPATGAWAPEVHFYKGKYYLFTTLHNPQKVLAPTLPGHQPQVMRSTMIAVSDSPTGPFTLTKKDAPLAPANFMTLDGTFYVDPAGHPWMVYAHEWVQKIDGTMEALPLNADLSAAAGPPIYLFKASDAPWIDSLAKPSPNENHYVTDGPELWRTKDGHLLMLWSSYEKNSFGNDGYVETVARSKSGDIQGPWEQLPVLVDNDSGHGMLFHSFDGQLMFVCHQPFKGANGKIYEVNDLGDHVAIAKFRDDLSGPPLGPQRGQHSSN
jgi:beta-xylosidase